MVKKLKKTFMKFDEELTEGIIQDRKGQFILFVKVGDKEYRCHCPTTGGVGGIILKNIPCLLSKSNNPKRATPFTVEAISLDKPSVKNKKWIGINQVKANKYIEYFLKGGNFNKMIKNVKEVKREQKLGDSKLDFLINNNCYMEVKSPLHNLNINIPSYIPTRKKNMLYAGNRLIKHMMELGKSLQKSQRAIMLLAFQYNSEKFGKKEKKESVKNYEKIQETVDEINKLGVESWQVNLSIDKKGISFLDHFKVEF
jgi:sugar fermentation stimulation protein A